MRRLHVFIGTAIFLFCTAAAALLVSEGFAQDQAAEEGTPSAKVVNNFRDDFEEGQRTLDWEARFDFFGSSELEAEFQPRR